MNPLVSLRSLSLTLNGRRILQDLTLDICAGEHVLLTGANGSGKSTFLKVVTGEVWPDRSHGQRLYSFASGGQTTSPLLARGHCRRFAPEMQERFLRLQLDLTAYEVISSGYDNVDYPVRQRLSAGDARIREFAGVLGIEASLARPARELSHGNLRRVLLARAAIAKPALLALDEAYDGLDAESVGRANALFSQLAHNGTTFITVSHAPQNLPRFLRSRCVGIESGHLLALPSDAALDVAESDLVGRRLLRAAGESPMFAVQTETSGTAAALTAQQRQPYEPVELVRFREAAVNAYGAHLLTNLDWVIREGQSYWLQGANGSGKSTLLETITGLQLLGSGTIRYLGMDGRLSVRQLQEHVALCSDRWQARYDWAIPVRDVVGSGWTGSIGYFARETPEQAARVHELITEFDLNRLATRSMRELSFGQRRLVLFARALLRQPKLLLLDETFEGVDTQHAQQMVDAVQRRFAAGMSVVLTSHQPLVRGFPCTHIIRLEHSRAEIRELAHQAGAPA